MAAVAPVAPPGDPVLAVGGDIACPPGKTVDATHCGQAKTGALLTSMNPNYVLPLGDSQYDNGTAAEYAGSYTATGWGTEKTISRPAAGNHEYHTTGATPYYSYFGANAGDPQKGYYSWDVPVPSGGTWHLIALNSECSLLGGGSITAGCGAGSSQETWLKADLAAHKNVCTIAYWHRPRFSSSPTTPSSTTYNAFWNDLYAAGADVIYNGHAHDYERFAPQTSAGVADPKGPTEYVVGTGGVGFQSSGPVIANSVKFNNSAFGLMKMTLHSSSYDFQFVPAAGSTTLADSGNNIPCHTAPAGDTTKPSAPTNVTATASSANQVNLSWTAATDNVGVKNYSIYRGSNGATPTLLATTTTNATTFNDTTVTASTPYTYLVYAQDAAGNVGPASNTASVTTPASTDTTPPTTPSALAGENVAYNEIDLGWTGSTDTGTGVSGYKVYRKGPGESTFTLLATQPGTGAGHNSHVDMTVKPSSAYTYYVTAYDGANNESAGSLQVTETTPSGPSSKTFTFTASDDATIQQASPTATGNTSPLIVDNSPVDDVLIKFNVATSGCETLTSAKLTLSNNADGSAKGGDFYTTGANWSEGTVNWTSAPTRGALLNSLGAVASNATATADVTQGVPLNGAAAFRIGSTSSDGVHYFSREGTGGKPTLTVVCATSAAVPDNTPPSAPANLTGNATTSGEVDLSWAASTDNLGVTAYDISRDGVKVGEVPGGSAQGSSLTYQDTTVMAGTTYGYTVKARDAAGNISAASNTATVTTPAATAAPVAPTNLTATATSGTSVNLNWTASTSPSVTGYNIYRGPQGGTLAKINSSGTSPFTDTTAVAATAYDYAVTAVTTGSPESAQSNIASVTTPGGTQAPGAPSNLVATETGATTVHLAWTASSTTGVTYQLYRGPTGGGLSKVGSPVSATSTDDTGLTASTAYDYAVTAVDSGGVESAPSNTATVTTPGGGGGGGTITAGTARTTQVTTAATTWTVAMPAFNAGDFVVIWCGNNVGSTAGTPASSGWTTQSATNESSGLKGSFLTRRMATGDPATITVTWGTATLGVADATAFTGVNTTTPVETKAGQAEASSTAVATHSTPSVTTTTAGDVLVSGFTTDKAATWTAGDTELADAAAGTVSASLYYSAPVTAGATTRSATAATASVKAVSSVLALKAS